MLAATAAKLLASLDLDTSKFEAGAKRVGGSLGQMESRFSRIGGIAKQGISNVATNLTRIGVVAAGAISLAVRSGIQSLADLERANQQTGAVIESTGGKAGVSAAQVRQYAEELENVTTADDKLIQSGENLLLTFTGISGEVFPQATKAMVDLSIAMAQGDVANADFKSSAIQIGKALNDPIRGVTALRRVGVQLTAQQEKQIKKFVESGDIMSAQKVILKELETEFGEAGRAAGEGFGGDLRRLDDAFEDSRMALATGFLPVIRKVADALTTKLADPAVQKQISDFGVTLAGAFDQLLQIGGKLPWAEIGNSLKIAGAGAKTILDAFTRLPPWVQTAVITGWGLNKLSGGALGAVLSEGLKIGVRSIATRIGGLFEDLRLGRGLRESLLGPGGALRGSTPANPLFTREVGIGGKPGAAPVAGAAPVGGGGGIASTIAQGTGALLIVDSILKIPPAFDTTIKGLEAAQRGDVQQSADALTTLASLMPLWMGGTAGFLETAAAEARKTAENTGEVVTPLKNLQELPDNITKKQQKNFDRLRERTEANRIALVTVSQREQAKLDALKAGQGVMSAALQAKTEQVRAAEMATRDRVESNRIAVQTGSDRIVAAIRAAVTTVVVNVSNTSRTTVEKHYGGPGDRYGNKALPGD